MSLWRDVVIIAPKNCEVDAPEGQRIEVVIVSKRPEHGEELQTSVGGAVRLGKKSEFGGEAASPVDFPLDGFASVARQKSIYRPLDTAIVLSGHQILRLAEPGNLEDLTRLPELWPRRFQEAICSAKNAYDMSMVAAGKF
jgi:hypothetical protein